MPVALVTNAARDITRAGMLKKNPGQPVDETAPAKMTEQVRDMLVGKAVGSGYATLEKNVLVSVIDLSDGKLTANGKPIELPTPKKPAPADAPEQAPPPREAPAAPLRHGAH